MRAALLVRRNWRATVFLVLLAGLAGGIAHRCLDGRPPHRLGVRPLRRSLGRARSHPDVLPTGDDVRRQRDGRRVLQLRPRRRARGRPATTGGGGGGAGGMARADGRPPVRAGSDGGHGEPGRAGREHAERRRPAAAWSRVGGTTSSAPDEVVINELLANRARRHRRRRSRPDVLVRRRARRDRYRRPTGVPRAHGRTSGSSGVVRGVRDIAARESSVSALTDDSLLLAGPAVWDVTADAAGFQSVLVEAQRRRRRGHHGRHRARLR